MQEICNYLDCIIRKCKKYAVKICRNMQFYVQNMHKLYISYIAFICTPTLLMFRFIASESGRVLPVLPPMPDSLLVQPANPPPQVRSSCQFTPVTNIYKDLMHI